MLSLTPCDQLSADHHDDAIEELRDVLTRIKAIVDGLGLPPEAFGPACRLFEAITARTRERIAQERSTRWHKRIRELAELENPDFLVGSSPYADLSEDELDARLAVARARKQMRGV